LQYCKFYSIFETCINKLNKMDTIDKKLLEYLQQDAKKTTKELSSKLNLSVTAVYERIKKLEREGVISKYVTLLDKKKIDKGFMVICQIKLVQHNVDSVTTFEKEIVKLEEVLECYHVSGDYDYFIKIFVKDMEAYREFMLTKLTTLQHIGSTHSVFMIGEVKNTTVFNM
jgi:Lrp/AsnC family transcriptional regulator, leucine-responsive regulatory protein